VIKKTDSLDPRSGLSEREAQIMDLAALGLLDKEIVSRLGVSLNTVKTYWSRIRAKLGQSTRAGLIAEYVRARTGLDQTSETFELHWELDLETQIWRRRADLPLYKEVNLPPELPFEEVLSHFHPDDLPRLRELLASVVVTDTTFFIYGARVVTATGIVDTSSFIKVVRDDRGRAIRLLGHRCPIQDVSRPQIQDVKVGHWRRDVDTLEFTADESFLELFGLEAREPDLREAVFARFPPEEQALTRTFVDNAVAQGKTADRATHRLKDRIGGYRWLTTELRIEYDPSGKAVRALGTCVAFN
jgi:DNA-binding CsgD family transcriptional regulator